MYFLGAAYVNYPTKRISTTVCYFALSESTVVYSSKTQLINMLSSKESEHIYSVTAAKTVFFSYMLWGLGFSQEYPTPVYEYNDPNIDIVNSNIPTEKTCHIYFRLFATQFWKEADCIIMHHIPEVINPANYITRQFGWVLHSRPIIYLMGYYNIIFFIPVSFFNRPNSFHWVVQ